MSTDAKVTQVDMPNIKFTKLDSIITKIKVCDDFYVGAINVLNTTYLPKWSGEKDAGYNTRIASTTFVNMFAPVVDGIAGLVTKKAPTITGFDNLELNNIDLKFNDIGSFIKTTIKKSVTSGICFISAETNKALNRSFLKRYEYKDLYSYHIEDNILKQIVFRDTIEVQNGIFGVQEQERFIVFKIGGGEIWYGDVKNTNKELKKQDEWSNTLKEIPLVAIITGKVLTDFEIVPKLLDIAIMNRVHLNMQSNLANVMGKVGNPIPLFWGTFDDEKITFDGNGALLFKDKQTEGAEYLEIKGLSVDKLVQTIKDTESQIDKLTFNLLLNDNSQTVIDAQQKQSKNTSFLSDIANECENKFERLLKFMLELENKTVPTDANLDMQKDFDATFINIEIAFKALSAGQMSRATFYEVLRTGKLPKDFDITQENKQIESDLVG
jgi:hypothetical protein